jgi:leucyl-tRNA synthetase
MMADTYNPQEIEPKWQKQWEADGLYATREDPDRPKWYLLTMLPYTSGDVHVGHWYPMTPSDAAARYKRMQGYNVFFPVGFDAFGLPAENAAIERGIHPHTWTMSNIANMRRQFRSMGAMWAWDREAITCLPEYYKWTQWFFLKFYEMGVAYWDSALVDFCPHCNTVLAREQVQGDDRHCERCKTRVLKKDVPHWKFRITQYADELLDFSQIDWPERVRVMQTNWIGRSEGAEVVFTTEREDELPVFTTRPDTLWGATFMVLSPEHPLVDKLTTNPYREAVATYQAAAARLEEKDRTAEDKEKTGVFTGAYAINPVNGERIPIWIADYVLMTYGTGAIMAVPGHDQRDFDFALKFGLPIIPVIAPPQDVAKSYVPAGTMREGFAQALAAARIPFEERGDGLYVTMSSEQADRYIRLAQEHIRPGRRTEVVGARWAFVFEDAVLPWGVRKEVHILTRCQALEPAVSERRTVMEMLFGVEFYRDLLYHNAYGTMMHSDAFSGTPGDEAVARVTGWLEEQGTGKFAINYRLRDWLISRQRYWGAPIPMIHCPSCGIVPVPYADLPVRLPEDAEIPKTGENALLYHAGFRNVTCPQCGGPAQRETDTMDTFMCSSWYHYAYVSPYWKTGQKIAPDDTPWDPVKAEYWLPVDQYTGGIEHATMHLLYTRFFTKVLRDMGLVTYDEPMLRLFNQGMILGADNEKMSKSRGNVIAPDDVVATYGADALRAYLMFIGPWEEGGPWNPQGIEGVRRFQYRVWSVVLDEPTTPASGRPTTQQERELRRKTHQTIRKVTEDLDHFAFNTMIAALMELNNALVKAKESPAYRSAAWHEAIDALLLLLAPSMPHLAEELWQRRHPGPSIHLQSWPAWSEEVASEEIITLVIQVNGKVRDRIEVAAGIDEAMAKEMALASPRVQEYTAGKTVRRVIFAGGKLVNVVAN